MLFRHPQSLSIMSCAAVCKDLEVGGGQALPVQKNIQPQIFLTFDCVTAIRGTDQPEHTSSTVQ